MLTQGLNAAILVAILVAAIFSILTFLQAKRRGGAITNEQLAGAFRNESVQISQAEAEQGRLLRQDLISNLGTFQQTTLTAFRELGESVSSRVSDALNQASAQQKERLDSVNTSLTGLTQTVEARLETIRVENSAKLEEMRTTVDEKLQSTLNTRLGDSFARVVEQLERVHSGIGEMQALAAGVGDLKRILANVRARGTFGEVQAETLLDQILSPEQVLKNVQIKEGSGERVEFAVKLPGSDAEGDVLLPIDAKFPLEDYERLITAVEAADADGVANASKALENRLKFAAKTISEKYIAPPRTTDFAILFLPTESLYAEVLRRPGLFEQLQRDYHVALTGPTTLAALLNALQMGFRTLAIKKRSGEVWQILGAVTTEFSKYNEVVDRLAKQLSTVSKSVETLGIRSRAMNRKLRDVEKLPEATAGIVLGPTIEDREHEEPEAGGNGTIASEPSDLGDLVAFDEPPIERSVQAAFQNA
jgi:DNA recombination protein RmuC